MIDNVIFDRYAYKVGPTASWIYANLRRMTHSSGTRKVKVSVRELAKRCQYKKVTIMEKIRVLKLHGLISIEKEGQCHVYEVHIPPFEAEIMPVENPVENLEQTIVPQNEPVRNGTHNRSEMGPTYLDEPVRNGTPFNIEDFKDKYIKNSFTAQSEDLAVSEVGFSDLAEEDETAEQPKTGVGETVDALTDSDPRQLSFLAPDSVPEDNTLETTPQSVDKVQSSESVDGLSGVFVPAAPPLRRSEDEMTEKFLAFYARYPRKVEKPIAFRAWRKQKCESIADDVMAGLEKGLKYDHRFSPDQRGDFRPYPATWLNARGWENEFDVPEPTSASSSRYEPPVRTYRNQRDPFSFEAEGVPAEVAKRREANMKQCCDFVIQLKQFGKIRDDFFDDRERCKTFADESQRDEYRQHLKPWLTTL